MSPISEVAAQHDGISPGGMPHLRLWQIDVASAALLVYRLATGITRLSNNRLTMRSSASMGLNL